MKNKLAIIAALVLASTSVVTAYAVNSEKNDGSEPTNIKVTGSYIDSKSTIMSVDVEWEEMNFTYFGGHKVWNPETHSYTTESASWWYEPKEITVTNHSNSAIKAQMNFASKVEGLNGRFDDDVILLKTAEGTTVDAAPKDSTHFSVSGAGIETNNTDLGTITVTISEDIQ